MNPSDPDWPRCACGCGEPVPVQKSGKNGRRGKPCRFVAGHSSRIRRKPIVDGRKECSCCGEWKPLERFSRNKSRASGYEPRCKDCFSKYHRDYNVENRAKRTEAARKLRAKKPDYQRQNVARWRKRNYAEHLAKSRIYASARRARIRDQFVEDVDAFVVYERDEGICGLCGEPADREDFHVDHVVPLTRGGMHSYENVQIAHPACNNRKYNKMQHELEGTPYGEEGRQPAQAD